MLHAPSPAAPGAEGRQPTAPTTGGRCLSRPRPGAGPCRAREERYLLCTETNFANYKERVLVLKIKLTRKSDIPKFSFSRTKPMLLTSLESRLLGAEENDARGGGPRASATRPINARAMPCHTRAHPCRARERETEERQLDKRAAITRTELRWEGRAEGARSCLAHQVHIHLILIARNVFGSISIASHSRSQFTEFLLSRPSSRPAVKSRRVGDGGEGDRAKLVSRSRMLVEEDAAGPKSEGMEQAPAAPSR